MAKQSQFFTTDIPQERKEEIVVNKFLDDTTLYNGLWYDKGSEDQILPRLQIISRTLLIETIIRKKDHSLAEKICIGCGKTCNQLAIESMKERIRPKTRLKDSDFEEENAYIDFISGALSDENAANTFRQMQAYYTGKYQKEYELAREYCEIEENGGDRARALFCLQKLYIPDCYTVERFVADVFFMGYEAYLSGKMLPFYCAYVGVADGDKEARQTEKFELISVLFSKFEDRACNRDTLEDMASHYGIATEQFLGFAGNSFFYSPLNEEEVKSSPCFQKYYRKRREALCKIFECEDDKLAETIYVLSDQQCFWEQQATIMEICMEYGIYCERLGQAEDGVDKECDCSIAFIDEFLLPNYYLLKLERLLNNVYKEKGADGIENITRRELYNDLGMDECKKDAAFFSQMYYIDVFGFMVNKERQELYKYYDFSGKNSGSSLVEIGLRKELDRCIDKLNQKDNLIAELKKKKNVPAVQSQNKSNEKYYRGELVKAEKRNEDLMDENAELKVAIEQMENYIALVEAGRNETEDVADVTISNVEESLLHGLRLVFVCGSQNINALIRKEFPGSNIYDSETQCGALRKKTDYVVFFTQYISHAMYFRFKAECEGVTEIYYNGSNIDRLKRTICDREIARKAAEKEEQDEI